MGAHELEVLDTAEAVYTRGAEVLAEAAKQAVAERGTAELAVSGGSDPWPMFSPARGPVRRLGQDRDLPGGRARRSRRG